MEGHEHPLKKAPIAEEAKRCVGSRYEYFRPYETPSTLDALHGPSSGTATLPKTVFWQTGRKTLSIDDDTDAIEAYQAIISEATSEDQERYLNRKVLVRLWPNLTIPLKAQREWERRFPELKGNWRSEWIR